MRCSLTVRTNPPQVSTPAPSHHGYHHPSPEQTESHLTELFKDEEKGYHKGLKARQVQMIAIGGAIGTGLFLGAGGRLAQAGPALVFIYALCGFFAFLVLRALGELVLHRPSSGSFVSYAREFYGEKAAFAAGWMYWLNWAMTAIVDVTAVALYMKFFGQYSPFINSVPQWVWALVALAVVLSLNLVSVKVFGEMEFWFALIKVVALVAFLVVGTYFVLFGTPIDGHQVGFSLISDNGGWLRIGVFYIGSVLLLVLLLPYTAYQAGVSPFVTFFDSIGVDGAGMIMNLVVLTAALSSLNAGLYSTGRILRSMAMNGSAPKFAARMNKAGVPYGGIAITAAMTLLGVGLNAVVPESAFEIVLNVASLGIIAAWGTIVLCQIRLKQWADKGLLKRPSFRMIGAPFTSYLTLAFLVGVLVLIAFDYPVGTFTIGSLVIIVPALVGGWFLCRGRITAIAEQRAAGTDPDPDPLPTTKP